ncbi:MAG: BMP family ABC transporter substrate-binding protein [Thermoleophilia bacterium]|nr:BMP family ABC transporter substrate-binding protein [Thermoleophilia bacterium]
MSLKRFQRGAVVAATLVIAAALVAGCGKSGSDDNSSSSGDTSGPKVGLVTDVGGLNDHSFNFLANEGFKKAKKDLGATGSVIESKSDSDYTKNLGSQVQSGADLVVGIGFLMGDAIKSAAEKAPDTDFAIVDFTYADDNGDWTATDNVAGILFKEQEAGYLAGVLAGAVEQDGSIERLNDKKVVSAVGGQKIPPVDKYIAGFKAGVMSQCKDCEVLVDYSQDFVDQAKCQDRANKQISKGSDIVFQVAGQCGLGALDAAKTKGVWGIGVDADQAYLGDHILTSAMKNVDEAVFQMIQSVKDDDFPGGETSVFGLEQNGVDVGEIASPAQQYADLVEKARQGILDGTIEVPETV